MAGSLYLGSTKVCPVIEVKSGYQTKNAYFTENVFTSVDANGKLTAKTTTAGDLVFTGFKDVGNNVFYRKFANDTSLTNGVLFNDLEQITGRYACNAMFTNCANLQSASFPRLKIINAEGSCYMMFDGCSSLNSVSFPNLTKIDGLYSCYCMFSDCSNLVSISFPKLSEILGAGAMDSMLWGCKRIEDLYFPSLTTSSFGSETDQFFDIFDYETAEISGNVTVHFPSNLQSTIAGLDGYPDFGGDYTTLAFDLPATS